jgi:hypothetical protein
VSVADAARRRLRVGLWPSAQLFVSRVTREARDEVGAREFEAISEDAVNRDPLEVLEQALRTAA